MKRLGRVSSAVPLAALFLAACTAAPPSAPAPAPAPEPEPAPAPAAPSERPAYVVKADKTQLRDDPTTKSMVLGRLSKGTRVTGMNEKDGWIFVRLEDSRVGWIRADLLRRGGP